MIGQGQTRVILLAMLVVLAYTMLHTKYTGHWSTGSGKEVFMFLPYMGVAAMLVMRLGLFEQFFVPITPWRLYMKIGNNWPSGVRGKIV